MEAEDKDWNEEWEKNFFQPIIIGNRCVIHSTFHHDVPQAEYDIDEWCVRNSIENIELNNVTDITVEEGDASALKGKGPFDVVIANINRNILLNDMKQYVACMHPGSELYMSGFYVDDIPVIRAEAERNGLTFVHHKEKNRWAAVRFTL